MKKIVRESGPLHFYRWAVIQKGPLSAPTKMFGAITSWVCIRRSPWRLLWTTTRSQVTHFESPPSWILLALHGKGLNRLHKIVSKMSGILSLPQGTTGRIDHRHMPMALQQMGTGHTRTFPISSRTSQIPHNDYRLLHEVDQGQTISHHSAMHCRMLLW